MKNKLLVLGLIALMLAGGLALASCHQNCPGSGNCDYNSGKDCGNEENGHGGCINKQKEANGSSPSIPYTCDC